MQDKANTRRSQADSELARQIRGERKFTLSEAIGRLAGPGAMKGASPVARKRQAELEIADYIRRHLQDAAGAFQIVLLRHVKGSELLLNNFDQPRVVLAGCIQQVLNSDYVLKELVREADIEWGREQGERPYFEREGAPSHPQDPYTFESIRTTLSLLAEELARGDGQAP